MGRSRRKRKEAEQAARDAEAAAKLAAQNAKDAATAAKQAKLSQLTTDVNAAIASINERYQTQTHAATANWQQNQTAHTQTTQEWTNEKNGVIADVRTHYAALHEALRQNQQHDFALLSEYTDKIYAKLLQAEECYDAEISNVETLLQQVHQQMQQQQYGKIFVDLKAVTREPYAKMQLSLQLIAYLKTLHEESLITAYEAEKYANFVHDLAASRSIEQNPDFARLDADLTRLLLQEEEHNAQNLEQAFDYDTALAEAVFDSNYEIRTKIKALRSEITSKYDAQFFELRQEQQHKEREIESEYSNILLEARQELDRLRTLYNARITELETGKTQELQTVENQRVEKTREIEAGCAAVFKDIDKVLKNNLAEVSDALKDAYKSIKSASKAKKINAGILVGGAVAIVATGGAASAGVIASSTATTAIGTIGTNMLYALDNLINRRGKAIGQMDSSVRSYSNNFNSGRFVPPSRSHANDQYTPRNLDLNALNNRFSQINSRVSDNQRTLESNFFYRLERPRATRNSSPLITHNDRDNSNNRTDNTRSSTDLVPTRNTNRWRDLVSSAQVTTTTNERGFLFSDQFNMSFTVNSNNHNRNFRINTSVGNFDSWCQINFGESIFTPMSNHPGGRYLLSLPKGQDNSRRSVVSEALASGRDTISSRKKNSLGEKILNYFVGAANASEDNSNEMTAPIVNFDNNEPDKKRSNKDTQNSKRASNTQQSDNTVLTDIQKKKPGKGTQKPFVPELNQVYQYEYATSGDINRMKPVKGVEEVKSGLLLHYEAKSKVEGSAYLYDGFNIGVKGSAEASGKANVKLFDGKFHDPDTGEHATLELGTLEAKGEVKKQVDSRNKLLTVDGNAQLTAKALEFNVTGGYITTNAQAGTLEATVQASAKADGKKQQKTASLNAHANAKVLDATFKSQHNHGINVTVTEADLKLEATVSEDKLKKVTNATTHMHRKIKPISASVDGFGHAEAQFGTRDIDVKAEITNDRKKGTVKTIIKRKTTQQVASANWTGRHGNVNFEFNALDNEFHNETLVGASGVQKHSTFTDKSGSLSIQASGEACYKGACGKVDLTGYSDGIVKTNDPNFIPKHEVHASLKLSFDPNNKSLKKLLLQEIPNAVKRFNEISRDNYARTEDYDDFANNPLAKAYFRKDHEEQTTKAFNRAYLR